MTDWSALAEFRELWFPSPRIRLPELGPSGPVFIEGGRCISGALGEYTKLWVFGGGRCVCRRRTFGPLPDRNHHEHARRLGEGRLALFP